MAQYFETPVNDPVQIGVVAGGEGEGIAVYIWHLLKIFQSCVYKYFNQEHSSGPGQMAQLVGHRSVH